MFATTTAFIVKVFVASTLNLALGSILILPVIVALFAK